MLDIYLIADEERDWSEPRDDHCIGSLSLGDFRALVDLWPQLEATNVPLCYFGDARLMSQNVKVASDVIRRFAAYGLPNDVVARQHASTAIAKLDRVLRAALSQGKGIIAFCD